MKTLPELYTAWNDADDAWTRAIQTAFPNKWSGDVRYSAAGKGTEGSLLRVAYMARMAAQEAFYAAGGAEWLRGALLTGSPNLETPK